ncbi:MAG: hypothetical protein V2J25_18290 [Desulfatiglans sp.]|jgi:hypothetical protein|nr:hypothetical protein [Thermodesulfobacteriota bacterium]MEE4354813.1 hypothetical protein [Desulfatiglans sp.]
MHQYWRISEELKYLGEVLIFYDPSISREYERWIQKKADVLALSRMDDMPHASRTRKHFVIPPSLN